MSPAQFIEFLLSVSIQATLIVCITHWLCRIVESPRLQCRLWNSCHIALLLVLIAGLLLPHLRTINPWCVLAPQSVERVVVTEAIVGRVVCGIWAAGAIVSLGLLVREWLRAFRFLKSCRVANEHELSLVGLTENASSHGRSVPTDDPVRVLISGHIGSPFCCQWHRPHLVIPEFMMELAPSDIQFIARHELEHLRRGHPLQLFVERLVATAYWFHPVISWAARQSSLVREYACDDAAVTERREIVGYLKTLLAVAERGLSEETEGAALFFGRGASVIALRGRRLLARAQSEFRDASLNRLWWAQGLLAVSSLAISLVWAPLDALASSQTHWSPWPQWSAQVLRTFDMQVRDFEPYEERTRLHELSTSSRRKQRTESGSLSHH